MLLTENKSIDYDISYLAIPGTIVIGLALK